MEKQTTEGGDKGQLVTFRLGHETYGIEIFKIQEVLHYQEVTAIPDAPEFVEGVIRVRDRIIPVVDLRKRFGIKDGQDAKKRIVVLDLERPLGVVVDDISRVLKLGPEDYEALPETVVGEHERRCIARVAKTDTELVIIITPEWILSSRENEALGKMGRIDE